MLRWKFQFLLSNMKDQNHQMIEYNVTYADAFWHFKVGDAFCCFPRQSSESVTAIFGLFRASQLHFPGEEVLDETKDFSYGFLREREANNALVDKWVLLKDLPGEVYYDNLIILIMVYFINLG